MIEAPRPSEYYEYYGRYVDKVPEGNIITTLGREREKTLQLLSRIPPERGDYCYAPGKWSIKEVIGHIVDSERVFAYRALSFARRDPAQLPSMEQDDWAKTSNAGSRGLHDLMLEYDAVRQSSIALFGSFDEEISMLTGVASGYMFSVRSIAYIIVGHEIHHRVVLEDRYME